MIAVVSAGIAPGLALLCYFYLKDDYEVEPISMVVRSFIFGAILVFPIMFIQYVIHEEYNISSNFIDSFLVTGLLEEFIKWFILFYTVYQHIEFDEVYDGIVYGVSVSLGFATVENILYLFAQGVETAIMRAMLPVSSHALLGVVMGYYLGKARFSEETSKNKWLILSLLTPFMLHGLYDYIILIAQQLVQEKWILFIIPFMIFLWWLGLRKVKKARAIKHIY
ncbi:MULTISPECIES: glutamic-type intramembrane protease PrsW [Bacillaceae]|uniref:glutamic-type intramembrane protease PrsW n=1 Tax=Bacillaceae TaxID=186817 RepID=UPI002A11B849|nr:glutamic-type intramembrane protease PrsW [Cytobacillus sp. IB215316]MDX8359856.1 glutamic-type intramembrane protease PrsW [Cytobacillus sp. IB215316]